MVKETPSPIELQTRLVGLFQTAQQIIESCLGLSQLPDWLKPSKQKEELGRLITTDVTAGLIFQEHPITLTLELTQGPVEPLIGISKYPGSKGRTQIKLTSLAIKIEEENDNWGISFEWQGDGRTKDEFQAWPLRLINGAWYKELKPLELGKIQRTEEILLVLKGKLDQAKDKEQENF